MEELETQLKSLRSDRSKLEEKKKNIDSEIEKLQNKRISIENRQGVLKKQIARLMHKRYIEKHKNTEKGDTD